MIDLGLDKAGTFCPFPQHFQGHLTNLRDNFNAAITDWSTSEYCLQKINPINQLRILASDIDGTVQRSYDKVYKRGIFGYVSGYINILD